MKHSELARALFNAFEAGDEPTVRSLCHADMQARQNLNAEMDLDTLIRFSLAVKKIVPDLRYENIVCADTSEGFVEEHDVCGSLPDGSELRLGACVVATVESGQVVNMREYVDSASAKKLLDILSG